MWFLKISNRPFLFSRSLAYVQLNQLESATRVRPDFVCLEHTATKSNQSCHIAYLVILQKVCKSAKSRDFFFNLGGAGTVGQYPN